MNILPAVSITRRSFSVLLVLHVVSFTRAFHLDCLYMPIPLHAISFTRAFSVPENGMAGLWSATEAYCLHNYIVINKNIKIILLFCIFSPSRLYRLSKSIS